MTQMTEGPVSVTQKVPCQFSGGATCEAACLLLPLNKNSGNRNNCSPHLQRHNRMSGSQEGARIEIGRKVGIEEGDWQCSQRPPLPW